MRLNNSQLILRSLCLILVVFSPMLSVAIGQQTDKPITKGDLIRSFEPGRREKIGAESYIELITRNGVDFLLTAEDEKRIRVAGRYLGKKGIEEVITAVRNNYRPNVAEASSQRNTGEPTDTEMKEALLLSGAQQMGGQLKADGCVAFDNFAASSCARITNFEKLGCKLADQGAGYFCTYYVKMSFSIQSREGPDISKLLNLNDIKGTTTKRFVRGKEGWLVTNE